jgi:sulfur-oxidizing protein SoxY
MRTRLPRMTRRSALAGVGATALIPLAAQASAPETQLTTAIREITKGVAVAPTGVRLVLPELAENGNLVQLAVTADLPMTPQRYVRTIHILSDKNPLALVARYHFTPRMGRARVASNIRLADTQTVVALAEMSDGTFHSGRANVVVTLAACLDGG